MRSLLSLLFLIFLALPEPAEASPEAVQESFLAYKKAVLEGNGAAAAELVTQGSKDLYHKYANDAVTLDRDGLNKLHVTDRVSIMLLRHNLKRKELEGMSGGEIIAYAVDRGWVGKESVSRLELGDYQVDGNVATGTVLGADGRRSPYKLQFLKEAQRWRLDLVAMLMLTRTAIDYTIQQTGMAEDEFVLYVIEISSGQKPGPEIWNPLL